MVGTEELAIGDQAAYRRVSKHIFTYLLQHAVQSLLAQLYVIMCLGFGLNNSWSNGVQPYEQGAQRRGMNGVFPPVSDWLCSSEVWLATGDRKIRQEEAEAEVGNNTGERQFPFPMPHSMMTQKSS